MNSLGNSTLKVSGFFGESKLKHLCIKGQRGLFRVIKNPDVNLNLVELGPGSPLGRCSVPGNASILGASSFRWSTKAPYVLGLRNNAKVFFSIIKRIAILVINLHVLGWVHNKPVHQAWFSPSCGSRCSKNGASFRRMLFELGQKLKVLVVNYCKKPLSKWNLFHCTI